MRKLIEVKELKKHFQTERKADGSAVVIRAVDGVSFSLEAGKVLAVVGESGSGKTTLARCIAGLETPCGGEMFYAGKLLDYKSPLLRRKVQYIFQDTYGSLNPRMRIFDALAEPLEFHFKCSKKQLKSEVMHALAKVGMSPNMSGKYPHELSGGQRQRVGIARALTMKPSLIIADEPVSSLDVSIQAQILKLFTDLNKRGITIIFITHDLRVVKNFADMMIVMNEGKVVERGKVDAVYKKPKENYTKLLLSSIPNSPYKFKI